MTTQQSLGVILKAGFVGGVTMAVGLLLLPREPIYVSLAMAVGLATGFLTWRPAGFTMRKHALSVAFAGALMFAIFWGIQLATGPLY